MQSSDQSIDRVLPPEILLCIFGQFEKHERLQNLYNSTLVCRVFNSLAKQVLYRDIVIDFNQDEETDIKQRISLLRTLEQQPQLYVVIRTLFLGLGVSDAHRRTELDVLRHASPYVRDMSLSSHEALDQAFRWPFYAMDLERLHITGPTDPSLLAPMISGEAHARVRSLDLFFGDPFPEIVLPNSSLYTQRDLAQLPDSRGLSDLQRIRIIGTKLPLLLAKKLMTCPNALKSFVLDIAPGFYILTQPSETHYLSALQEILDLQKTSLVRISLAQWLCGDGRTYKTTSDENSNHSVSTNKNKPCPKMLDLSAFPCLRRLFLHRANLFATPIDEMCDALSAPNLEFIQVDMVDNDKEIPAWVDLEDDNIELLVSFARRRQETLKGKSTLREIRIEFRLSRDDEDHEVLEGETPIAKLTTFDRLPGVAVRLEEHGIVLTWPHTPESEERSNTNSPRQQDTL